MQQNEDNSKYAYLDKKLPVPLSEQVIDDACNYWIKRAESHLSKVYNAEVACCAGEKIYNALLKYNGEIPINAWIWQSIGFGGKQEYTEIHGRKGSRKAKFNASKLEIGEIIDKELASKQDSISPVYGIENRETLIESIRIIDDMPCPQRWIALCSILGDYSMGDINKITGRSTARLLHHDMQKKKFKPPIRFNSYSDLADAMILSGARLMWTRNSKNGNESNRLLSLSMDRSRPQWHFQVWMMVLIELHDVNQLRMSLYSGEGSINKSGELRLRFKTAGLWFLRETLDKWYPEYKNNESMQTFTPEDLQLSKETLLIWMASSLGRKQKARDGYRFLPTPFLARRAGDNLVRQIWDYGLHARLYTPPQRDRSYVMIDENHAKDYMKRASKVLPTNWLNLN